MRRTIVIAFLSLAVPVAAWAKGGAAPAAVAPTPAPVTGRISPVASGGPTTATPTTSTSSGNFNGTTTSPFVATSGANGTALPPPPPQSLTQSPEQQGVPASPPPLPIASNSIAAGNPNNLTPQLNNQIRPSSSANAEQVSNVQATLAAGGLYTGPIDGINSASVRASVAEFQQLQNLPVTGNLDAETMARLNRAPATGIASNGASSTAGTPSTATGFSSAVGLLPTGTPSAGSGSPVITSQPFPLSVNINMSPYPPAGTTMQP